LLLDPEHRPGALSEALLMVAARADLVATVLQPARADGRVVLCDRYADSTLAYQGAGRGIERSLLERLNRAAIGDLVPDLTLLFDLDPEIGLKRRQHARGAINRLDREPLAFHRRVRACYLELAETESERFVVLDANRTPAAVEQDAWQAISTRLDNARS